MPLVPTVVPFLAGMKTSVDQVGWFMSPAPGGETGGSGRMSQAAWPMADAAASPCRCRVTVLLKASLRRDAEVRPVHRSAGGCQRERRRRRDGEVGDLHDRAAVDRQQEPIADDVHVVEVVDDHVRVVAEQGGDLVVRVRRVGDGREHRSRIAGQQVGAFLVLERLLVGARRHAVVVDAGGRGLEVADVQGHEAAERALVGRLGTGSVELERRARAPPRWPGCARRSPTG